MFNRLINYFRKPAIREIPISFELDKGDNEHLVTIYRERDGRRERVSDYLPLTQYGYREEVADGDLLIYYQISDTDRQTLLALKSMNPDITPEGGLAFPFAPAILTYARKKENLFVLLKKEFTAVLTDEADAIEIVQERFKPVVKVDKKEPGWLDFNVSYHAGRHQLPHHLINNARDQEFIQLGPNLWVKNDSRTVDKTEKQLQKLNAELTREGYRTSASQFASLEEFIADIGGISKLSAAYQAFLDQLTGFTANERFRLPTKAETHFDQIGIQIRPYQRAGIHWLHWLQENHLHGLLADDMGLGKSLMSICALYLGYNATLSRQHSLIVSPKSVLYHWQREINRFAPQLKVYPYHGPNRRRRAFQAVTPTIFLSTYQTISNDLEAVKNIPFYYLILDEATRIKNPQAKRTQAMKALNSAHRLALSGTPVENRPAEMWSIFDFLMRGHLGRYGTFERIYERQIENGDGRAADRLGKRVKPFMLRRLKTEVAKDLPDKIEMDEWCDLTNEQRNLYGSLQETMTAVRSQILRGERINYTMNILPLLQKLKQICDHPAIEDQATDRVHRIGQDKTVYVYRIMVKDTLEERIETLLMDKRYMADQIVGAAKKGERSWTRDELLELLRPLD